MSTRLMAYFDDVCSSVLWQFDIASVPTDLEKLASRLGVNKISKASIEGWGYVERANGEINIVLSDRANEARTRFSLAHEIGHVILEYINNPTMAGAFKKFRRQAYVPDNSLEEALADHIAGALLMPTWFMKPYIASGLDVFAIQRAARDARVSQSAAMFRAVWLSNEPCVAFSIRELAGGYRRVLWSRGSPAVQQSLASEDLANGLVVEALTTVGLAEASGLNFAWSDCQCLSRDYMGVRTVFGLAKVKKQGRFNAAVPFHLDPIGQALQPAVPNVRTPSAKTAAKETLC